METPTLERRDFLATAARAVIALGLLDLNTMAGQRKSGLVIGTVTIDLTLPDNSALTTIGGSQYVSVAESPNYPLIVVRNTATQVSAFLSRCTHKGGQVGLPVSGVCTCPLHGAQYDDQGNVTKGPATVSLDKFQATLSGSTITIQTLPSRTGLRDPSLAEPVLLVTYAQHARTLHLEFPDRNAPYRIRLYTLSGRALHEAEVSDQGSYRLHLPQNETGACILSVSSPSQRFTYHFNAL